MFGALVSERFYHGFSSVATCFACVSNSLLICAIAGSNVKDVGPYRFLLITFAVLEILISIVHFALIPCIHLTECGVFFWGYRSLQLPTEQGVWTGMLWVILFHQTFVLTAFHYVYRFVLVCRPPWLAWIQRAPWRNWICIALAYDLFFVGIMATSCYQGFHPDLYRRELAPVAMNVYQIDLLAPSKPGFLGTVFCVGTIFHMTPFAQWEARPIISIAIIAVVFSTSLSALLYCPARIVQELSPKNVRFSSVTISMQRQLFRALLCQTIISLLSSYLPIAFIAVAPTLTGVEFGGLGTIALMSTQIFPMVDPLIVLFYIQGYLPREVVGQVILCYALHPRILKFDHRRMFPGEDPLLAIGPDNRTYWLMLLVRSEAIVHYKCFYHAAILLEVAFTLAGFYLHYRGFTLVWKHKIVHINLMIILINMYAMMLIGSLARLATIFYETRIIELPSLGSQPVPTLAMLRQTSFAQAFFFLYFLTIERFCATIFVGDYERTKRFYIPAILCLLLTGSSVATGYIIVTGIANGILVSALALMPNIVCAAMFRRMISYNKRRHARLTDQLKRYPDDEYSLSLRVQLKENIWSMQKIEFAVYAVTAALAANLLFVFLPVVLLTEPAQFELLQWFTCAGNVGFAFSITATAPLLEVIVSLHKGHIPPLLIRIFGRECFETTPRKDSRNEGEIYFIQLAHQWAHVTPDKN